MQRFQHGKAILLRVLTVYASFVDKATSDEVYSRSISRSIIHELMVTTGQGACHRFSIEVLQIML